MKLEKCYLKLLYICLVFLLISGCAHTYVPKVVKPVAISYSGNAQNAGFVGFTTNGVGVIDANAREKFNYLATFYGTNFVPPVVKDYGLTPFTNGTYLITSEALSEFMVMNTWRKNEK